MIGDSLPLSGDLADFGPPGREGRGHCASTEINAAIEEAGVDHTVELVNEDNCGGADQQCAVQAPASWSTPTVPAASPAPGLRRHDPDRRVGRDPRGGRADLARFDER